jgi:hypothetical protein
MFDYDAMLRLYLQTDADVDPLAPEERQKHGLTDREKIRRMREFVLREGTTFDIPLFPADWEQRRRGECFAQCLFMAADPNFVYVEGFAIPPNENVALHHAWCEHAVMGLLDCTWGNAGRAYFGVRFSPAYILKCWEENPGILTWSLLDNRRNGWGIINGEITGWRAHRV